MNDNAFALVHEISEGEAIAYRRGHEARERGDTLHYLALSTYDAWYAAGWHDRDMEMGNRVTEVAA